SGYVPYAGPVTITGQLGHTVTYYSEDLEGNKEAPSTISFKIDSKLPSATAVAAIGSVDTIKPTDPTTISATYQGIASDPVPGSGLEFSSAYYVVTDSAGLANSTGAVQINTDGTFTFSVPISTYLPDGVYIRQFDISVVVFDKAGNYQLIDSS